MERKPDALAETVASTGESNPSTAPTVARGQSDTEVEPPVSTSAAPSTLTDGGVARPSARYQLGSVLGRGGMGEVLTARDEQIGRAVAIKRMRGAPDDVAVARFLREAKIQGRLEHPAIVPVHELCTDDEGRPYFVMKQLTGITLADVLASKDPVIRSKFNRQSLLRAFADVCLAIEFAHTRGVIHRDLKPANIMLGDFGEVYVLDWGIARLIGDATERTSVAELEMPDAGTVAGALLGTPGYMSPEQIRGEALDTRADVFALGCILYELLAGRPLYPRGTEGIAMALDGHEAHPAKVADVPPELDEACARAAASDRAERTASAREISNAVQRFLDGDRDLELRRTLARDELARARAAVDRGDTEGDRRDAIRAAGRALALDPHAPEPAALVGRLMLDPPAVTPPEVQRKLDEDANTLSRTQLHGASFAMLGYLPLVVNCYLGGIREMWFLVSLVALIVTALVIIRIAARQPSPGPMFQLGLFVNCGIVAVLSRGTSPFLLAPLIALLLVTVLASQPRLVALPWLVGCALAAVLIPFGLELAGVLEPTIVFEISEVRIRPVGPSELDPTMISGGLCIGMIITISIAGSLVRSGARDRDRLLRRLQLQAWQLGQLMPQR